MKKTLCLWSMVLLVLVGCKKGEIVDYKELHDLSVSFQFVLSPYKETYYKEGDFYNLAKLEVPVFYHMNSSFDTTAISSEIIDSTLPQKAEGEYMSVALKEDGTFLQKSATKKNNGTMTSFETVASITYKEGSWTDFKAGKKVVFSYTKEGLEAVKKSFSEQLLADFEEQAVEMMYERAKVVMGDQFPGREKLDKDYIMKPKTTPLSIIVSPVEITIEGDTLTLEYHKRNQFVVEVVGSFLPRPKK